ncbi:hypothetical protein B0H14DRAFT_3887031 [Mycena olivaceomarginata]|nr:hypothetical protein B0H14DRAFT_3887031 [Mycena olivaceomarginata]
MYTHIPARCRPLGPPSSSLPRTTATLDVYRAPRRSDFRSSLRAHPCLALSRLVRMHTSQPLHHAPMPVLLLITAKAGVGGVLSRLLLPLFPAPCPLQMEQVHCVNRLPQCSHQVDTSSREELTSLDDVQTTQTDSNAAKTMALDHPGVIVFYVAQHYDFCWAWRTCIWFCSILMMVEPVIIAAKLMHPHL